MGTFSPCTTATEACPSTEKSEAKNKNKKHYSHKYINNLTKKKKNTVALKKNEKQKTLLCGLSISGSCGSEDEKIWLAGAHSRPDESRYVRMGPGNLRFRQLPPPWVIIRMHTKSPLWLILPVSFKPLQGHKCPPLNPWILLVFCKCT